MGLDVVTTRPRAQHVGKITRSGTCILFSSHLMHEVRGLADRVLVMPGGDMFADGSVAEVIKLAGH